MNATDTNITKAQAKLSDASHHLAGAFWAENEIRKGYLLKEAIQQMARAADLLGYTLVPKRTWNDASINGSPKEEPEKCQTLQATECQ